MKTSELYSSVTNRIIAELKEGTPPWVRPWKNTDTAYVPMNCVTGRNYSGINTLILWATALDKGYPTHNWVTFQQANKMGANVRKGEKSTTVVFVKHVEKEEDGEKKKSTILKSYSVFNTAQLENVPNAYLAPEPPDSAEVKHDKALALLNQCGIKIVHGGNKAAYYPHRDEIVLPPFGAFTDEAAYWGVANHELIHATGHESRLARKLGKRFGKKAYAFEEMVAELGSSFLCARIGIPPSFRSSGYIKDWLEVLENDNRAVFTAASYASQASDFLWEAAFHAVQDENTDPDEQARRASAELAA